MRGPIIICILISEEPFRGTCWSCPFLLENYLLVATCITTISLFIQLFLPSFSMWGERGNRINVLHLHLQGSVGIILCFFTSGNTRHGRSCRANMQWCPRSVDVFVMDWSTYYFLVFYLRERLLLLVVCGVAFRSFITVIHYLGVIL